MHILSSKAAECKWFQQKNRRRNAADTDAPGGPRRTSSVSRQSSANSCHTCLLVVGDGVLDVPRRMHRFIHHPRRKRTAPMPSPLGGRGTASAVDEGRLCLRNLSNPHRASNLLRRGRRPGGPRSTSSALRQSSANPIDLVGRDAHCAAASQVDPDITNMRRIRSMYEFASF